MLKSRVFFGIFLVICTLLVFHAFAEDMTLSTIMPATQGEVAFKEDADAKIYFNYSDTTYDGRLRITAGKEDDVANTQGACVDLHGNNEATYPGQLHLVGGTAGYISFWTGDPVNEVMTVKANGVLHLTPLPAAPASADEGDIYVNSTNHHVYCYLFDGGVYKWKQMD